MPSAEYSCNYQVAGTLDQVSAYIDRNPRLMRETAGAEVVSIKDDQIRCKKLFWEWTETQHKDFLGTTSIQYRSELSAVHRGGIKDAGGSMLLTSNAEGVMVYATARLALRNPLITDHIIQEGLEEVATKIQALLQDHDWQNA